MAKDVHPKKQQLSVNICKNEPNKPAKLKASKATVLSSLLSEGRNTTESMLMAFSSKRDRDERVIYSFLLHLCESKDTVKELLQTTFTNPMVLYILLHCKLYNVKPKKGIKQAFLKTFEIIYQR